MGRQRMGGLINIKETGMTTYWEALPGIEYGLSGQVVLSIYQDEEQKIWIGTDGGGINKFNPDTRKFNQYHRHASIFNNRHRQKATVSFIIQQRHILFR